jgi:hypothetical protein
MHLLLRCNKLSTKNSVNSFSKLASAIQMAQQIRYRLQVQCQFRQIFKTIIFMQNDFFLDGAFFSPDKLEQACEKFAKTHSVNDEVFSVASFTEGWRQGIQYVKPDRNVISCPKCNSSKIRMEDHLPLDLELEGYDNELYGKFICYQCKHTFSKTLKISVS